MLLYRICHSMYARDLSGEGARLNGGRWNEKGIPCIYTSSSRSLALLEYTCHVKKHLIPRDLSFVTYQVPDDSIHTFKVSQLPGNWKHWPHPKDTQDFGTKYLKANKFLLYQFPSVVIEQEMNIIINPTYSGIKAVKLVSVDEFIFDLRLKSN